MSRKTGGNRAWLVGALLIFGAALACGQAVDGSYKPLTAEEADRYIAAHRQEAIQDIIAYDLIEHTAPVVAMPDRVLRAEGRDLVIEYRPAYMVFALGPLVYHAALGPERAKGVLPARTGWLLPALIALALGAAAGAATVALLK